VGDTAPEKAYPSLAVLYTAFYLKSYRRAVGVAYGISGSRAAAEEIAQEAFLVALRRWAEVSQFDDPSVWVYAVTINIARNVVRRRLAEMRAMKRWVAKNEHLFTPRELSIESKELWKAVRRLPRRQAQVIVLHYQLGYHVDEIAKNLGISSNTVKVQLKNARAGLAKLLSEEEA
jgi:RNA polymerase sigma-70 factor (ECF subfamily)